MKKINGAGKYRIKVLQKSFRLLELFSEETPELSISEITEKLKYNKTTLFRIISNLEEEGYLDKDPETNRYRLGIKLYLLGSIIKPHLYLKATAKPILNKLNLESGETVHLAVLHKGEALYVDKIESKRALRVVVSQVGRKLPAHCSGVGKVLLAYLPMDQLEAIVAEKGLPPFTLNTITTLNQLKNELSQIVKRGYAHDNEEIELGLKCVAAPVFFGERAVAAVSISVPGERFNANYDNLVRLVIKAAQELTNFLGENVKKKQKSISAVL